MTLPILTQPSKDVNNQGIGCSSTAESNPPSPISSTIHVVLEDLQKQMRALTDRFDQATFLHTPIVRAGTLPNDSRPSSTQSIRHELSSDILSEEFLRAEAKYLQLKSALELRSCTNNNNNNGPVHHSTNPPSQPSGEPFQSIQPLLVPLHSTTTTTNNVSTSLTYPSSSAFEPINKASSSMSMLPTSPALVQPLVSRHPTLTPTVTMTINNNLPTFKGLAHERPIQFINDFEIRASALVGNNDSSLLQTIQQSLSDGALIWFGQLQKSSDRITTWSTFKARFHERYRTATKIQSLRTELRLLFQSDNESTLDYFDRLKALMNEIDPDGSDNWLKHKFIQKLRSDIRTRLDIDVHLPVRDIVRKAQLIESNIEQQKVDEKLKLAVKHEKKPTTNLITNDLSLSSKDPSNSSVISPIQSSTDNNNNNASNNFHSLPRYPREFHNNLRHTSSQNHHNRTDFHRNTPSNDHRHDPAPSPTNRKSRWWCPHCQRSGHSWERCPHNPDGVNYRLNSSSNHPPSSTFNHPSPSSSRSPSFHHNSSPSENRSGR